MRGLFKGEFDRFHRIRGLIHNLKHIFSSLKTYFYKFWRIRRFINSFCGRFLALRDSSQRLEKPGFEKVSDFDAVLRPPLVNNTRQYSENSKSNLLTKLDERGSP